MNKFYSADWHLGHENIIGFCDRPFTDAMAMSKRIVAEANMRCKPGDLLTLDGDTVFRGKDRGLEGSRLRWSDYRKMLFCDVVLVEGNHDRSNDVKTSAKWLVTRIGNYQVFVAHHPTGDESHDPLLIDWVRRSCHFALVGHVHNAWAERVYPDGFVDINVGVDVRKFRPMSEQEILSVYEATRKRK